MGADEAEDSKNAIGTILECKDLTKRFGGITAVYHFSCVIPERKIIGLIGPNGAGKTTLINIVSGHLKADSGQALLRGKDITGMRPHVIARMGLTRTFQVQRPLIRGTVIENVMVGSLFAGLAASISEARRKAAESCQIVGLGGKASEQAENLTAQQKQLLQLARALATDPELLVLDEVLAGLNPAEAAEVSRLLLSLRDERGIAIISVEHNMQAIMSMCDHLIVMSNGRKLTEGDPREVAHDTRVIETYLGGETTFAKG